MQNDLLARYDLERRERWRELSGRVPFIPMKADWQVCPLPPFSGAFARFYVRLKGKTNYVSVYLDIHGNLGAAERYWEVYPVDGDTARCAMHDVTTLSDIIERALSQEGIKDGSL